MAKTLYQDYFIRAEIRLQVLDIFIKSGSYADTIRESQELVELLLKAVLRKSAIDPPHWHDVSRILKENSDRLHSDVQANLTKICQISKSLRKERELSFYGDEDFIPSEEYGKDDAISAKNDCQWLLEICRKALDD